MGNTPEISGTDTDPRKNGPIDYSNRASITHLSYLSVGDVIGALNQGHQEGRKESDSELRNQLHDSLGRESELEATITAKNALLSDAQEQLAAAQLQIETLTEKLASANARLAEGITPAVVVEDVA